jgi:hypothetical protein
MMDQAKRTTTLFRFSERPPPSAEVPWFGHVGARHFAYDADVCFIDAETLNHRAFF